MRYQKVPDAFQGFRGAFRIRGMGFIFWNLDELKARLRGGTLSEAHSLVYWILSIGFLLLDPLAARSVETSVWDWVLAGVGLASVGVGGWRAYRWNGGAEGKDFLKRLVAIAWVVGFRIQLRALLLLALAGPIVGLALFHSPTTSWPEVVVFGGIEIFVWFRVVREFRDMAAAPAEAAKAV